MQAKNKDMSDIMSLIVKGDMLHMSEHPAEHCKSSQSTVVSCRIVSYQSANRLQSNAELDPGPQGKKKSTCSARATAENCCREVYSKHHKTSIYIYICIYTCLDMFRNHRKKDRIVIN